MIEREDGPVKHYRMVCDKCGKRTKRFAHEFDYSSDAPAGWKEVESNYELTGKEYEHYCPKCAKVEVNKIEEIVPNVGDADNISDHDDVPLPLTRESFNKLVIDLGEGRKWIITSSAAIKVEQHQD